MAYQTLTILDDFYENYDAIRKLALSLNYGLRPGSVYPGNEAIARASDWTPVRAMLRQFIKDPVDGPCTKDPPFVQGKFRVALADE
ncbi:MAG: hypothetical protein NVS3B20_09470 [Polyangiales bacterium]